MFKSNSTKSSPYSLNAFLGNIIGGFTGAAILAFVVGVVLMIVSTIVDAPVIETVAHLPLIEVPPRILGISALLISAMITGVIIAAAILRTFFPDND